MIGRLLAICLGSLLLAAAPAMAASCKAAAPPAVAEAAVAHPVWEALGKFAFLIGREPADDSNGMTLMTRLRAVPSFASVRTGATEFGSMVIIMQSETGEIGNLSGAVGTMEDLCRQLDAAGFDHASLDRKAWGARLAAVHDRVDAVRAPGPAFVARMRTFAAGLSDAAKVYDAQHYLPNPAIDIGPAPDAVAAAINDLAARWRIVFADLDFVASKLAPPHMSGDNDEAAIANLTSAATALRAIQAKAQAIAANAIPFPQLLHFLGGDYLYDDCAGLEGRFLALGNLYYARQDGVLTLDIATTEVRPHTAGAGSDKQLWRLDKVGEGYWTLTPKAADRTVFLGISAWNPSGWYEVLPSSASISRQAMSQKQYWRCYDARNDGTLRFINATLGEGYAMDTFRDDPQVIMAQTGNFLGQYWRSQ